MHVNMKGGGEGDCTRARWKLTEDTYKYTYISFFLKIKKKRGNIDIYKKETEMWCLTIKGSRATSMD